ncbi:MAG: ketopantoate reductase family protein [Ruminococcus sp.]|nr:ketopantoate reductase family protein [Ruminococcus sp.]
MKILIYGAGVIGCLYAALFAQAGYDVSIYARGARLEMLKTNGLQYKTDRGIKCANVKIVSEVNNNDRCDFIFVTVREHQLYDVLAALRDNVSPNIVTMVNSLDPYGKWEKICGKNRIIPAFPGAGGGFDGEVLDAALTPRIIQPTTFAETDGRKTQRTKELAEIFKRSGIPYRITSDMHAWQVCHLAMVVPIADAYYETYRPEKAGCDMKLMRKTARRIKRNFSMLKKCGAKLVPIKMELFRILPTPLLTLGLSVTFKSSFGDKFMYRHSMKAPDEMRELHRKFYSYLKSSCDEDSASMREDPDGI